MINYELLGKFDTLVYELMYEPIQPSPYSRIPNRRPKRKEVSIREAKLIGLL